MNQTLKNPDFQALEAKRLTALLRMDAISAGWPKNIYIGLFVRHDPNGLFYIYYPEQISGQVEELEFGLSEESAPQPVIRPFLNNLPDEISEKFLDSFVDSSFLNLGDDW